MPLEIWANPLVLVTNYDVVKMQQVELVPVFLLDLLCSIDYDEGDSLIL